MGLCDSGFSSRSVITRYYEVYSFRMDGVKCTPCFCLLVKAFDPQGTEVRVESLQTRSCSVKAACEYSIAVIIHGTFR